MILEEIQRPPFIHFGLMKQSLTIAAGESFKIYQRVVYNGDYVFRINGVVAKYENDYTENTAGTYTYDCVIDDKLSGKQISGNTITVTVV